MFNDFINFCVDGMYAGLQNEAEFEIENMYSVSGTSVTFIVPPSPLRFITSGMIIILINII